MEEFLEKKKNRVLLFLNSQEDTIIANKSLKGLGEFLAGWWLLVCFTEAASQGFWVAVPRYDQPDTQSALSVG